MGIIIKKYPDLTTPTPAYGGKVWHAFSPKTWTHFLVDGSKLERLDGVTGVLKKAIDKSQPLMRWAVKLALTRARAAFMAHMGPDACIQIFEAELDKILESAKKADTDALDNAGECGHAAHDFIDRVSKAIIAKDTKRLEEILANFPEDERAENGAIAALDFLVSHNVRIVKSEFRALSLKHKCCGTGDMLALVDSCDDRACCSGEPFTDRLSYLDWKTSNYLYVTYLWQAALYADASMEEFPELKIVDRWILRLDKDDASFEPWHAAGDEAQAEDLHGFLCCLATVRALDKTQARIDAIVDVKKAMRAEQKALDKLARDRIECPKAKDYQGVRRTKCLPDGSQCQACKKIWEDKHGRKTSQADGVLYDVL
jgi:hypothetical protein